MRIAVLGTGMVGQAVAARLDELGHDVTVGTRDPAATLSRTDPDAMGNPGAGTWASAHPSVSVATFADAAATAELVVNATSGDVSLDQVILDAAEDLTAGEHTKTFALGVIHAAKRHSG